ncbi:MAG: hypothetical protein QM451_00090 [Bacillota bacterium]|nr:hypothetical protein [Bacillota bacterium]
MDGTAKVGIGAAVAINQADSMNRAYLGQGTHEATSLEVTATTPGENKSAVEATAGAGSSKVGIAGAVGINIVDNTVDARINPSAAITVAGGDVTVQAQNDATHMAKAAPSEGGVSGDSLGVGASVALNIITEQVTAEISRGANLSGAGGITVDASSDSDTETEAKAGAEGGIAIDAAVAVTTLNQSTRAIIAEGGTLTTLGNVAVSSSSTGSHQATASGETKSGNVGIGAAVAVIVSNSSVSDQGDRVDVDNPVALSLVDRDLTTGGDLTVTALADRRYRAIGTASAKGAKADADQKGKSRSTSTLSENQGSQKGTQGGGTVTVAAAVGVTYINDDVLATIPGGESSTPRSLNVGGDLEVSALNASNFTSQGSGAAVDEQSKVGIGVGVGLSIQRNDTLASLGDYTTLRAKDLKVLAESKQNRDPAFVNHLAAEAVAGASAENVGVAGALAVVDSASSTKASLGRNLIVTEAEDISVVADNTSKLAAKAWAASKGGKVGVGASVATIVSKNQYAATIGSGSQILQSKNLDVIAMNRKVEGSVPFEFKDFESLDLQALIGENNYYTEVIAGAGGDNVAVAGAFAVNVFEDETVAVIGADSNVQSDGEITVQAENDTTAKALSGGVALKGQVGVGLASSDIVNKSTTQSLIERNVTLVSDDLSVTATAQQELAAFGVSAAGADKFGVAGVANVVHSENTVEAAISDSAELTNSGDLTLFAQNGFKVINIAGGAAGGGTGGIGASVATTIMKNKTLAYLGRGSLATVLGTARIEALARENLLTISAGGAYGGTAGVAGSSVVNVLNTTTHAFVGAGSRMNLTLTDSAGQNVYVRAEDQTDLTSVAGAASYGGTAGIGAAADVGVINKDTQAYIDSSSGAQTTVNAGNTVGVSAHAEENLISVAAGFAGGGTVGVAGTAGVYTIDNITRSFIGEYAQVHTGGNVLVSALNKNKLLMVSGSAAGSGTASVGGSGAVVTSNRLTEAYIGSFADVSALGKHEAINAYTGEFDEEYRDFSGGDGKVDRPGYAASDLTGDGTNDPIDNESLTKERSSVAATDQVRGVAVTAVTQDHLEEAAVGGAASGTVAVTGAGAVGVIESQTSAEIRSNAKINQTGENAGVDQKVLVAAGTDYYSLGIGGALSGSGGVAVGPGAHVSVVELGTTASIGNDSEVRSRGDITVSATTSENILSIAAAGSASAYAAISGAVTVSSLTNRTHAFIGDRAQVTADRSLSLSALDSTKYTTIAGGVALAVTGGGVGGSVAVNVINKDTQAFIGRDADVNAKGGALAIHAISEEDLLDVVASGGIGLFAGAAGAVAVNSVNSNTYAFIKDGARINQDTAGTTASQHVDLLAKNDLKLLSIAGTLAGGAVGVSGGVDVVTIKNNTAAYVEDGVNIKARGAFGIEAQSGQDIESYAVSAGAGAVGVAGAVSVVSVGSDLELDSKSVDGTSATSALETSDGSENVMDYAHGQITGNVGDQLLAGYEDTHIQGARDSLNAKTSTITQDSGGSVSVSGTQAFIGEGAQVEVGSLDMKATTDLEVSQSTGGVAGGVVGAGGAVSIATLNANTNASVGRNSNVQSTGAVKVTSELDQSYEGYSIAGAVGYTGSLAGSLVYLDDRSSTFARLDDDTSVQAGSLLLQSKAERDTDFVGVGASAGLAGPALSGTVIIGDLHGTTQAQVGPRAKLSITGALTVGALSDSQLTGTGAAPAGGLLAGLGAAVTILEDRTEVVASIEDDVEITKAGAVQLEAAYTPRVSGHTTGVGVGGLAVGASITDVRVSGQVRAFIGDRVEIGQQAGSSVGALSVRARFGSGADTAQATTLGGAAGGVAGAGSDATAVVNPTVSALVGHNARVNVAGNLQVRALSNSGAKAQSIGLVGAALGVGLSFAEAELKPVITAAIGDSGNIVAGGSVHLGALHNYDEAGSKLSGSAEAKAVSATGALVGGNGSDADAEASAQVASSIGSTFMQVGSNLEIVARSSNKSDAQADGVAAGGLVAAGAVTADSKTQGETTARLNGLVTAGNLSILAESTDYVTALTRSGAGGIAAGSGSIANARANSSTMASTGESLNLSVVGGAVSIRGEARSQAEAKARGVNAGGLAVGVSKAVADNRPTVMAYLGNKNAVFSDKLTIQARSLAPANGGGTLAESEASGGGLVGVNATISEAKNVTNVTSFVGDDSILRITGDLKVLAEGNSTQKADSTAITAGVVAVGSNSSLASSNSTISAHLGQGVAIEGGTVSISAQGRDDNYAESTAGSGGVVAGTAANAATSSRGGARAWIGQDVEADASSLELKAEHTVDFNAKTDSTSASLLGASGASTDNTVNYTVEASIDDDSKIEGENLGILAINRVIKDWVQGHNVQSGSGGVVDAAAVQSKTMINADTKVTLGENVLLAVVGDRKNPGALVIEGFSDLRARDRVKLDAGGAISVALAESKIQSARNTILQIGKNSTLTSVGDLDLSVWNRTDTQTAANVKTYGGAGAAQGKTLSQASINSSINIGQDVHLLAFKDTNLRIGSNRTGQKATQTVLANTDLWNKTVLPIETKPDADAYLTEKSDVVINTGSHLESVGHLRLLTDGGSRNVRGYGVGKDLYREALQAIGQFFSDLVGGGDVSLEIKAGRSSDSLTTGVRVDGIAEVGIENKRFLTIGPDGQVDASRSSEGYTISANAEDLSNEIQERIDELTALIQALDQRTGQSPSTTTDPAVAREIEELNQEKTSTNSLISGLTADINSYIASNNQKANEISANNHNIATWNAEIAALSEDEEKNAEAISLRRGWISAAQNANTVLQNQINQNNQSKAEYEQTKTQLQNRIGQINARLNELAALNIPDGGPGIQALAERYRAEKAMLEAQLGGLGNTSNVQVLTVDQEIEARSSNIYITADNLVGSGKLLAPGDTLIEVRNESPHFLRTNKMTIPDEAGGRIVFNQVSVSSLADINKRNRNQTAQFTNILTADNTESRISVINAYVPYGGTRAPDLFVDGDVRNLTGAVSLTSTYGSVQIKDGVDIVADSIRITAGRDITIGYKDGFRNIAHDIQGYWDSVIKAAEAGKTDKNITQTFEQIFGLSGPYEPSLLAGNNIFVSGQYLNINGVIQSGLPQRTLVIPPSLAAEIAEYKAKFDRGEVTDRIYRGLSINTDVESDISKVAVFYDAVDNTLELAPIFTMGGYMELYGHIMNTGVGELRVMDGYSQIQVDNQTNYDLRLKDINTGNGIEGTIKITDTGQQAYGGGPLQTVIKRQGNTVYTYNNQATGELNLVTAVAQASGRRTQYTPRANQYYSWTVKDERTWTEKRIEYFEKWFGFDTRTKTSYSGIESYNEVLQTPVGAAVLRVVDGKTDTYWYDRTVYPIVGSWSYGSWERVTNYLVYMKEERTNTRNMGEVIFHSHNIAAFHPIKIEFLGYDQGLLSVTSKGGIIIDGSLRNSLGETNIQSTQGAITQTGNELAGIIGQTVDLKGAAGMGSPSQAVGLQLVNNGVVNADTTSGDLYLEATRGDLVLGSIRAQDGDVYLGADTGIYGQTDSSLVTGTAVNLNVAHGNVASADRALRVNTEASSSGGLGVLAAGDIHITEVSGDLYLNQVESLGGDVILHTPDGSILDNNTDEIIDTRVEAELLGLWSEMGLTGEEAKESALHTVSAYERMKARQYADYWQLRERQVGADGSALGGEIYYPDSLIKLTDDEIRYYRESLGWDSDTIRALEAKMTRELHDLHQTYGSVSDTYIPDWTYTVLRPTDGSGSLLFDQYDEAVYDEWHSLVAGFVWTEDQLRNSIGVGVLKETSDTRVRIEEPNVIGRNVDLIASGNIGQDIANENIKLNGRTWTELEDWERLLILTAESKDVTILSDDEIQIVPKEDLDLRASGLIQARAAGSIFLGSEADLALARIEAGGDIRIKSRQNISHAAAAGEAAIKGQDLVLEAARGSIGTDSQAMVMDIGRFNLTARAGENIYISSPAHDLNIDTIYAVGHVDLHTEHAILNGTDPNQNIRAESLNLVAANGGIGTEGRFLKIGLDPTGQLTAQAKGDIFINSPVRRLNTGGITSEGDITIYGGDSVHVGSAGGGIYTLLGKVTIDARNSILSLHEDAEAAIRAQRIYLETQNGSVGSDQDDLRIDILGQGAFAADAPGGIYITETRGDLNVDSATSSAGNISLTAVEGDVNLETAAAHGGVTVDSKTGDTNLKTITAQTGDIVITAHGEANLGTLDAAGGSIRILADLGSVQLATATAYGELALTADQNAVVNTARTELGDLNLRAVRGDVTLGTAAAQGGNIGIMAEGDVEAATITAYGNVDVQARTGDAKLDTVLAQAGSVAVTAQNDVLVGSVTSEEGDVNLTAVTGDVPLGFVSAQEGTARILAGGSISGRSDETSIVATSLDLQAVTGAIGHADSPLNIDSSNKNTGTVRAQGYLGVYLHEVDGALHILAVESETEDVEIAADGSITGGQIKGEDITLSSIHGSIGEDDAYIQTEAGGRLNASAQGNIYLEQSGGDLISDQMLAAEGSIGLRVPDGQTQITQLSAGDGVTVRGLEDLWVGQAFAGTDLDLAVAGEGQYLEVDRADVGRSLSAHADHIRLPAVQHIGAEALLVAIGGGSKRMADSVVLNIDSPIGVIFTKLYAADMTIHADTDELMFLDVLVGNKATFSNRYHTVVADNVEKRLYENVALQLLPEDRPFSLRLGTDREIWTTAYAVNYNDYYIITNFDTINSFIRITTKLADIMGDIPSSILSGHSFSRFSNSEGLVGANEEEDEDEENQENLWDVIQIGSAI